MREATTNEKAWMSGFIDGEGYIGTLKTREYYFHPRITVSQCEGTGLELFVEVYGGKLRISSKATYRHRVGYIWTCPSAQVGRLILDILPYLRVKKTQADLILEYLSLEHLGAGYKISEEVKSKSLELHNKLKALNTKGPKRVELRLVS